MAHGVTTDKTLGAGHLDLNKGTVDATIGVKNVIAQRKMNWPGQTPAKHLCFEFQGTTVPDGTDYPDSIAPIGSHFHRYIVVSGVITGYMLYTKNSANTWTAVN